MDEKDGSNKASADGFNTPTFRSYIFDEKKFDDALSQMRLLEGEKLQAACEPVVLGKSATPSIAGNTSIFGDLLCTSFRVVFHPKVEVQGLEIGTRLWHDTFNIPLANIQSLSVRISKDDEFHSVNGPIGELEKVEELRLLCKDLRIWEITFHKNEAGQKYTSHVINKIRELACASKTGQLFPSPPPVQALNKRATAYGYTSISRPGPDASDEQVWLNVFDWKTELERCTQKCPELCGPRPCFRLTDCNYGCRLIPTYPDCFVVPSDSRDDAVKTASNQFINRRCPIWCWSHENGSSLFRSAAIGTDGEMGPKEWAGILGVIKLSHPLQTYPIEKDVETICSQLKTAYPALRKFVTDHHLAEIQAYSVPPTPLPAVMPWLSAISATGWPKLVLDCLATARYAIDDLTELNPDEGAVPKSVILRETYGLDATAILSSLVQICLDPFFRTQSGLLYLIRKEWMSLGHPFLSRLFKGIEDSSRERSQVGDSRHKMSETLLDASALNGNTVMGFLGRDKDKWMDGRNHIDGPATFLLFLDCTHQLLVQYPRAFAFTDQLLIALFDLYLGGLSSSFLNDTCSEHARGRWGTIARPHEDLIYFFNQSRMDAFANPLPKLLGEDTSDLTPSSHPAKFHFWDEMYLRWTREENDMLMDEATQIERRFLSDLAKSRKELANSVDLQHLFPSDVSRTSKTSGTSNSDANAAHGNRYQITDSQPLMLRHTDGDVTHSLVLRNEIDQERTPTTLFLREDHAPRSNLDLREKVHKSPDGMSFREKRSLLEGSLRHMSPGQRRKVPSTPGSSSPGISPTSETRTPPGGVSPTGYTTRVKLLDDLTEKLKGTPTNRESQSVNFKPVPAPRRSNSQRLTYTERPESKNRYQSQIVTGGSPLAVKIPVMPRPLPGILADGRTDSPSPGGSVRLRVTERPEIGVTHVQVNDGSTPPQGATVTPLPLAPMASHERDSDLYDDYRASYMSAVQNPL